VATVKAPLPGTFFRRSGPDADVYVSEGDAVQAGAVVGLIEVMKTYYEIRSEEAGLVERFLVEDGEAVEAGQDVVALTVGES
jgi:acetyl-CoA carboxylase biotin carboxyl carrier protein